MKDFYPAGSEPACWVKMCYGLGWSSTVYSATTATTAMWMAMQIPADDVRYPAGEFIGGLSFLSKTSLPVLLAPQLRKLPRFKAGFNELHKPLPKGPKFPKGSPNPSPAVNNVRARGCVLAL